MDPKPRRKMLSTSLPSSSQKRGGTHCHYYHSSPRKKPRVLIAPCTTSPTPDWGPWDLKKHLKGGHSSREISKYWEGFLYSVLIELLRISSINSCYGHSGWHKCTAAVTPETRNNRNTILCYYRFCSHTHPTLRTLPQTLPFSF